MEGTAADPTQPSDIGQPAHVRALDLIGGNQFVVALVRSEADLPSDAVRRELRVLAREVSDIPTRDIPATLISDGIAGIIGTAAWFSLVSAYSATSSWLERLRHGAKVRDVTTVVDRLRTACEKIMGSAPDRLGETAAISQQPDGRWQAKFSYHGVDVTASVDPTGSVVAWTQTPREHGEPGASS